MELAEEQEMCRETEIVGGKEFMCVLPLHGREFNNDGSRNPWVNGRGAPSRWRRHVMMKRYPMGDH